MCPMKNKSRRVSRHQRSRLLYEALESRLLLSAPPTFNPSGMGGGGMPGGGMGGGMGGMGGGMY